VESRTEPLPKGHPSLVSPTKVEDPPGCFSAAHSRMPLTSLAHTTRTWRSCQDSTGVWVRPSRLELQVALSALIQLFPEMRLVRLPRWTGVVPFRSLNGLRIAWAPLGRSASARPPWSIE